jgi:hypothetical protein
LSLFLAELQGMKHAHFMLLHQVGNHDGRWAWYASVAMHEDSTTSFERIPDVLIAGCEMLLQILPGDIHRADHSVLEVFGEAWIQSCHQLNNVGDALHRKTLTR